MQQSAQRIAAVYSHQDTDCWNDPAHQATSTLTLPPPRHPGGESPHCPRCTERDPLLIP